MNHLKPNTILKRANRIEIYLDSVAEIEICVKDSKDTFPNICLTILDVFTYPISLQEGLKRLKAKGLFDWIKITGNINKLYKLGVLTTHKESINKKQFWDFGSSPIHIAMLSDTARTQKFIRAINEAVKKGDVVIDIGTGTGVLAIAAARAGAAKVYAVEASGIGGIAQEIINKTEVADKIKIIRGWSTQIDLPQPADVLVSEIIGHDPFAENILQVFKDAQQRLLKSNAKLIPNKIRVFGIPVLIPSELFNYQIVSTEKIEDWKNIYQVDFSSLNQLNKNNLPRINIKTQKAAHLEFTSESTLLAEVDFCSFQDVMIKNIIAIKNQNLFNGFLTYFELELSSETITTHPKFADKNNHWLNQIYYLPTTKNANILNIQFKYTGNGSEVIILNDFASSEK